MMSKSHITIGLAASAVFVSYEHMPLTAGVILGSIAGSLLPDIDTPYSRIGIVFHNISGFIYKKIGHRSATHSILSLIFIVLLKLFIFKFNINLNGFFKINKNLLNFLFFGFYISFFISYTCHVLADMLTGGVYLFWPLRHRYRFLSIKVGSLMETIVTLGIAFLLVVCLLYNLLSV